MFSLLNKNKLYFLSEVENKFIKIDALLHVYKLDMRKSYNSNWIISPLNDIILKKSGFETSFKYPNKYNLYFKVYNIFSMLRNDITFYKDMDHIYVSSNLLLDFGNFSLKDFISYVMKKDIELRYNKGFGTFDIRVATYSTYWYSIFGYIIFGVERLNLKLYGYDIEKRYVNLEYYLLRQSITNGFNNLKLYIERNELATPKNRTLYSNVLSKIERIMFFYLDKNFSDISVYFHLNKRIKTTPDMMCTLYPVFNLMFFYDKYRKDFILLFDIVFSITHNSPSNRRKFYNSILMSIGFDILRTGNDVRVKTYLEFYPDNTYNNIELNVTYNDEKIHKESYKKTKDYKTYKTVLSYKDDFISEEDKNEIINLLKSIDKDMDIIYKKSKIVFLNGAHATEITLFG